MDLKHYLNSRTLVAVLCVTFACGALLAGSRAFRVSQDRQMERFYERAIQSALLSEVEAVKREEESIASLRSRQTLPSSLSMPEYLKRVREAPMLRNLELAVLKQTDLETENLRHDRQESKAHLENHQRRRERNTFLWTVMSLGLAVLSGISCLIALSLRRPASASAFCR